VRSGERRLVDKRGGSLGRRPILGTGTHSVKPGPDSVGWNGQKKALFGRAEWKGVSFTKIRESPINTGETGGKQQEMVGREKKARLNCTLPILMVNKKRQHYFPEQG